MQLPLSGSLSYFMKTLLGPTLFGLSVTAPARADETPSYALHGDSYLSRELADAVQTAEELKGVRTAELRGIEPIATPDSMFLLDEPENLDYQTMLTQVQVRQQLVAKPFTRSGKGL